MLSAESYIKMSGLSKSYDIFMKSLGVISGIFIFLISLLIFINVILRNTGGVSFSWVTEICEYGLSFSAFIAAPWVLYESAHVQVDFLLRSSPEAIRKKIELFINAVGFLVGVVLCYFMLRIAHEAFVNETLQIKSLVIPEWWLLIAPALCFLLVCVEFLRRIIIAIRGSN
ncbi:TRAP transporter small permease [Candidatus Thalassolituus haligoni]|uniref:TRAP transporter small permease n=1 Tax=Candidatus Thalassolituus haligoni TaxID=3100113 RepID=UPI003511A684